MRNAIIVLAVILTLAAATTSARADAVTDCGSTQGKAVVAVFAALFKEAARACGKGSAMNALAVSQATVGAAVGKFYASVGKGVDKSGPGSCLYNLDNLTTQNGRASDFFDTATSLAKQACLEP